MRRHARLWLPAVAIALSLTSVLVATSSDPIEGGAAPGMRRLTEEQYRNSIADLFGADIQVAGRMDPLIRPSHGLQTAAVSLIAVSPAGLEQYTRMAQAIAAQVVSRERRDALVGCRPEAEERPDDACATAFFGRVGRLAFRRPLPAADLQKFVAAAHEGARLSKNFYTGIQLSLETMLVSPRFLFDLDVTEPDPARPGTRRLDGYSKAARLSFFLWNTAPDTLLMNAAERGELQTPRGLARQVDRLIASPRLEAAVRTFFADMLGFETIADLAKDSVIYPQFVREVKADMSEQTLRTIVELLVRENADYRDLFTSRTTFMTRALAAVYQVPITPGRDQWVRYEFPETSPRLGVLTQLSFLATFSHDGRSSPTLRGKALRELLLCQPVPDPPANVNFSIVEDTKNPDRRTARDRLAEHRKNTYCANCHKIMDPIGLTLENFDGVGAYRTEENGAMIDASGDLDGVPFSSPMQLAAALSQHPALPTCLVNRVSEYAMRRSLTPGDQPWVKTMTAAFAQQHYRLRELFRAVATSNAFFGTSTAIPSSQPSSARKGAEVPR